MGADVLERWCRAATASKLAWANGRVCWGRVLVLHPMQVMCW
jgi:hypothetical protein